ncbi:uncharacterized protein MKK02DRAFT_31884 [Dioszegia hungarica]|uniref:Uncharacterized protein n=1 Tax=Dioszegia hungarica TaxID=4972 RepID=A0AA38HDQ0_9TREE|nr:uncharacterized protein MKK02DRAFT_31884 [Dioszegia hungarica]KAI9638448.1 hypothetical protein MKK02DRAFT_31884 [Dioszegia hungarica]
MKVTRDRQRRLISVTQPGYIDTLLARFPSSTSREFATPMAHTTDNLSSEASPLTPYQQIVVQPNLSRLGVCSGLELYHLQSYAQYARMLSDVHGSRFNSPVPIPWNNGTVSPSQIFAPPPSEVSTFSGISGLTTSSGTTLGSGSSVSSDGSDASSMASFLSFGSVVSHEAPLASYVPSNAGSSTSSDSTVVPVVIHPVATRGTLSSPHSVKSSESGVTRNTKVRHLRVAKIKATGTLMVPPCVRCLANGTPCYWSPDSAGCAECTAHARLCSFGSHKRRRTGYSPIWAYEESFVPSVNGPGQSTKGQLEAEFAAKVAIPGEDDELLGIAAPDGMVWSEEEEKFVRIEEELVDYDETPEENFTPGGADPMDKDDKMLGLERGHESRVEDAEKNAGQGQQDVGEVKDKGESGVQAAPMAEGTSADGSKLGAKAKEGGDAGSKISASEEAKRRKEAASLKAKKAKADAAVALKMAREAEEEASAAEADSKVADKREAAEKLEEYRDKIKSKWDGKPEELGEWGKLRNKCRFCWKTKDNTGHTCYCNWPKTGWAPWAFQNGLRWHNGGWYRWGVFLCDGGSDVRQEWEIVEALQMWDGNPHAEKFWTKFQEERYHSNPEMMMEWVEIAHNPIRFAEEANRWRQLGYELVKFPKDRAVKGWRAWPNPPGHEDKEYMKEVDEKKAKAGKQGVEKAVVKEAVKPNMVWKAIPTGPSSERSTHQAPPHLKREFEGPQAAQGDYIKKPRNGIYQQRGMVTPQNVPWRKVNGVAYALEGRQMGDPRPEIQQGGLSHEQGGPGFQHGEPVYHQGRPGFQHGEPVGYHQGGPGFQHGGQQQSGPGYHQGGLGYQQGGQVFPQGRPVFQQGGQQQGGQGYQQAGPSQGGLSPRGQVYQRGGNGGGNMPQNGAYEGNTNRGFAPVPGRGGFGW